LPVPPAWRHAGMVAIAGATQGHPGAVLAATGLEGYRVRPALCHRTRLVVLLPPGAPGGAGRSRAGLRGPAGMVLHVPVPDPEIFRGALRGRRHLCAAG